MSQHGALAMAQRGASAAAILSRYYRGARLGRPSGLPSSIRVALEPVRSSVTVTGPGRFRVLDGSGRPLAVAATGAWHVSGGQGKVHVVPPPGQEGAPTVEPTGHEPPNPPVGAPVTMRFRLSAPALVHLALGGSAGPVPAGAPALVEPGDAALALGPLARPGPHEVSIVADAGGGRVTAAPVTVTVIGTEAELSSSPPRGRALAPDRPAALGLVALVLWASVTVTGLRRGVLVPLTGVLRRR